MSTVVIVDDEEEVSMPTWIYVMISIAILLWILAGVAAFIISLACFGGSGTTAQKVIGFLLAFLFGPFYFIYFYVSRNYCKGVKFGRRR